MLTDTLHESLLALLRLNPFWLLVVPFWLVGGITLFVVNRMTR